MHEKVNSIDKVLTANYYLAVGDRMLPYIKGRRLSLVMCPKYRPNCFFRKNIKDDVPLPPIETVEDILAHVKNYTVEFHVGGEAGQGAQELCGRQGHSCAGCQLDMMVFDLDPDEGLGLTEVRQGVRDLKSILDELGLVSFLKTSGNKGYHILVPIVPVEDWDIVGAFAKNVAIVMEQKWPNRYTSNVRKTNRRGKIFIDWIRNSRGATSIVPYSMRVKGTGVSVPDGDAKSNTKSGSTVSAPIAWDELGEIAPNGITMEIAVKRLKKPNPWNDFFETGLKQRIK